MRLRYKQKASRMVMEILEKIYRRVESKKKAILYILKYQTQDFGDDSELIYMILIQTPFFIFQWLNLPNVVLETSGPMVRQSEESEHSKSSCSSLLHNLHICIIIN